MVSMVIQSLPYVGGFCCPAPPGPRYVLEHVCYHLGSETSRNDSVVVSSNKCLVIVGIYEIDPLRRYHA